MNTAQLTSQALVPHEPTTVLVTGGAGFIGSNFVQYWLERYPADTLINVDALTYAGNLENLRSIESHPNHHFVQADITDSPKMHELMRGVSLVVHFAAESHVDRSILEPGVFVTTNVLGTQVLLDAALHAGVRRFHHISTDEVFGTLPLNSAEQFSEHTPYDPRSPYSASKAGSDFLVRAYGETYGLEYTITNCSNNYGPFHFPEKLIPLAITNVIEGKKVPVYGDGLQVRDWLYVKDHCRAIELVLLNGTPQSTYLVGGLTEDISNLSVVKELLSLMQASEDSIEFVKDRPGHDRRYSVDWSKINRELGWEPSVSFSEGLQETISWYVARRDWWEPLKTRNKEYFQKQYASEAGA
jgi:dTDP-glucose 4,6-dehydratase